MININQILNLITKPIESYQAAKDNSLIIDELIGLEMEKIEKTILKKTSNDVEDLDQRKNFWPQLNVSTLMTPYSEIYEMIQTIKPEPTDHWIDLGSGYGRMGVTLGLVSPAVKYTGIEAVSERSEAAQKILNSLNIINGISIHADLTENLDLWQKGNVFFIYDFGSEMDIKKTLEVLKNQSKSRQIKVIARGRLTRHLILNDHPWLDLQNTNQYSPNWSLFIS